MQPNIPIRHGYTTVNSTYAVFILAPTIQPWAIQPVVPAVICLSFYLYVL